MNGFLPLNKTEMAERGWEQADFVYLLADAYVDHPSFGPAIISRVLESHGFKVAIIPQPDWKDPASVTVCGRPRLGFLISGGNMDPMVNHYTVAKKRRSSDAYSPGGRTGLRPDHASVVYGNLVRRVYGDIPVIIGGIEASLRRERHYDYWDNCMKPPILEESGADYLVAGMGEKPMIRIAEALAEGRADTLPRILFGEPMTTEELDWVYDLPFTRLPHPRYKGKRIPAYDMIKFSITTHRGCFGGCNFCAITAHQGKQIQSRSEASILREVEALTRHPEWKGTISDLGAPTANMYRMGGRDRELCAKCKRPSCLYPKLCRNLDHDHAPLLQLYEKVLKVPGVKHVFIGSGIRYDLFLDEHGFLDATGRRYFEELVTRHTSGRLKIAPEHTEDHVLDAMGKPSFKLFERLELEFNKLIRARGLKYEIIPYFISAHPGCTMQDMEALSRHPALRGVRTEQVQDFTPTPMTVSTEMFHTGRDPRTGKKVFVERDIAKKQRQKSFFFKKR